MEKFSRLRVIFSLLIIITANVIVLSIFLIPYKFRCQVNVDVLSNQLDESFENFERELLIRKLLDESIENLLNCSVEIEKPLKCGKFPSKSDLITESIYWQVLNTTNGTFMIFNAYYDDRSAFKNEPTIRIIAFLNRLKPKIQTFCQLWFKDLKEPVVVRPFEYRLIWKDVWIENTNGSSPYLIGCKNPIMNQVPSSVSLVKNECDEAVNNLEVIHNLPEGGRKKSFGVCVKDLIFEDDISLQIIEWVELLLLLGADKIFCYVLSVHPNVMKVFKYYETRGKVKVEMISRPNGLPFEEKSRIQSYQGEMVSLNDCLYKHMYEYEYLVPIDSDEIIMPQREEDKTWTDLIATSKGSPES